MSGEHAPTAAGAARDVVGGGGVEPAEMRRLIRAGQPPFWRAVLADARLTSRQRGRPLADAGRPRVALEALWLALQSDGFAAQMLYRAKARLQALGVPLIPHLLQRLAIMTSGLYVGDPVVIQPGVHLAHGQIVIDGIVEVQSGVTIFPFVTIGLRAGSVVGPSLGQGATIGSGAKVLGEVVVGAGARVGANAVVVTDVAPGATVVGVPAAPGSEPGRI